VPELRPGHLGEDPGFLGAVADRLVRCERLPVEVEGARQVTATGCQLREAAERVGCINSACPAESVSLQEESSF
jgi:hypothetical protein